MSVRGTVLCALAVALGALLVVAGERDDSPGLGGLGLLLGVAAVVLWWRRGRARRRPVR